MRRNGFTLFELIISFTIMVILMSLAVVLLRSTQADARDEQRKANTETIARGLEGRYNRNTLSRGSSASEITTAPGYPSVNEILYAMDNDIPGYSKMGKFITDDLPGTNGQTFIPPSGGKFTVICRDSCYSLAETSSVVESQTSGTNANNYVYEPITESGKVCLFLSDECVRFNLYYRTEKGGQLVTIRSQHQ